MDTNFITTNINNKINIIKDDNEITIKKDLYNNIWFIGNNNKETTIDLNVGSFDYNEFKTYHIFYSLIQDIMGKYVLQDNNSEYNGLPIDFINLDDKEIICHSDCEPVSFLKMKLEDGTISISIIKEKHLDSTIIKNHLKISQIDSQYGNYYNDFSTFYDQLFKYSKEIKKLKENQKRLNK